MAVLVTALLGSILTAPPAAALSQNELLVNIDWDGAALTGDDPLDAGGPNTVPITPTPTHTPGDDERNDNGVVRTYDQVQYRVDYNVNEEGSTGATLTLVLPPNMTWITAKGTVSATFPVGMFAGCLPGSTITSSNTTGPYNTVGTNDVLMCVVDDEDHEGNNGTIYPRAQLLAELDGTDLTMDATLTTTEDPTGISDSVDIEASAAAAGNFVKGEQKTRNNGEVYADIDDSYIMDNAGVAGRTFIYPIEFTLGSTGLIGSGPVDDTQDIVFYDHAWDMPASAQLAAGLTDGGRTECGVYDGAGPVPSVGTWTCQLDAAATAANGYPVVEMTLAGGSWSASTLTANANGTPNNSVFAGAQIAFWMSEADLDARDPRILVNTISQDTTAISALAAATPIELWSASLTGPVATAEGSVVDNDVSHGYPADGVVPSSQGGLSGEWIHDSQITFIPQTLKLQETDYAIYTSRPGAVTYDWRGQDVYPGRSIIEHECGSPGAGYQPWEVFYGSTSNGDCAVSRGEVMTLTASGAMWGRGTAQTSTTYPNQCIAIDNTHVAVVPVPGQIPLAYSTNRYPSSNSGFSSVPASDGIAHVITSKEAAHSYFFVEPRNRLLYPNEAGGFDYVLEFAQATPAHFATFSQPISPGPYTPTSLPAIGAPYAVGEDAVTCNQDDAVGSTWVPSTGDLSVFDDPSIPGADFGLINLVRFRATEPVQRTSPASTKATNRPGAGWQIYLHTQVRTDVLEQSAGHEIFAATSRNFYEQQWDPATQNQPPAQPTQTAYRNQCGVHPVLYGGWAAMVDAETTTGWCNTDYLEPLGTSLSSTLNEHFDQGTRDGTHGNANTGANASPDVTKVYIEEAKLGVTKANLAGPSDVADNGDLVDFEIDVFTVGSTNDQILDITVTDNLPANMVFDSWIVQPPECSFDAAGGTPVTVDDPNSAAVPPATLTAGGQISCDFGDHAGGWSDTLSFSVMIVNAAANTVLRNTAATDGVRCADIDAATGVCVDRDGSPVSASASAFTTTPAPFHEAAVLKAVDTFEGDCTEYPALAIDAATLPAEPADWADRCEMVSYEDTPGGGSTTMSFQLDMSNEGNTPLTDVRFVDVFPHLTDEAEPASNTGVTGDGRTPETDTTGDISFVSFAGADVGTVWVTGDAAASVSRDPDAAIANTVWCDAPGGAIQNGLAGACPATAADVTAIYSTMADIPVGGRVSGQLTLSSIDHECDDIWTNSFGADDAETLLPIRSNDVSIMVNCEFDLALRKVLDPAWAPDGAWLTGGVSTVDFIIEVHNQGDPVNNIDVTDYIDPTVWSFDPTLNLDSTSLDALGLAYSWDATGTNPVVAINDPTSTGHDPSPLAIAYGDVIEIPVTLTVAAGFTGSQLSNLAEISYFDNDNDAANGDTASGDLTDVDSIPDGVDDDLLEDDVIDENAATGDTSADGVVDEDDHDIATVPVWDLAIEKDLAVGQAYAVDMSVTPPAASFDITVTNEGSFDAYFVDVLDTPPTGMAYNSSNAATITATDTNALPVVVADNGAPGDWTIDALAAGDSVTITVTMDITDLTASPYVNSVQITDFDDDADPATPDAVTTVDVDSATNAESGDGGGGDDLDHTQRNEDDDDVAVVSLPFDLALAKTLTDVSGDEYTFTITVENQSTAVSNLAVTDYIDTTMWQPFDAALNADGPVGGTAANAFSFMWDATDPANPVAVVAADTAGDMLATGETIELEITLVISPTWDGSPLSNWAEVSDFDNNADPSDGTGADGTLPDVDSTPDAIDGNGPGEIEGDANVDDETGQDATAGGDEDDHDQAYAPVFDLALAKTVDFDATAIPVAAGDVVTFTLEVINQGTTHGSGISLVDYVDTALWDGFDLAINPAGTTTGDAALAYTWTPAGTDGLVTLTGALAPGESVLIPVALTVASPLDGAETLSNTAEITTSEAVDSTGDPVLRPNGDPLPERDSTADATNDDPVVDDDVTCGCPEDEDDHDIAVVPVDILGSIGDTIWLDTNADGIEDPTEPGIAGVVVNLLDAAGNVIATATTDANGMYLFPDLPAGSYTISVDTTTLPAGHGNTGDPDGGLDSTSVYDLGVGEDNLDQDFGYVPLGSIGDTIWLDTNADGIEDPGESGIAGVVVNLLDAAGNVIATATTDADGMYLFPDLPAGTYTISVDVSTLPAGYANTGDPDGLLDSTSVYELGIGEDNLDQDFGYVPPTPLGSIGDTIWLDTNADGIEDPGETGIAGVVVNLLDADGNVIATATTDANGMYLFPDLPSGSYTISVDVSTLPAGYANTGDPDGLLDSTSVYDLGVGEHNLDQDFGYVPGSIPFTGANSATHTAFALLLMLVGFALVAMSDATTRRSTVLA